MGASVFNEIRTAAKSHTCQCGDEIGKGDHYERNATPPWAFKFRNEIGEMEDYGEGLWIVVVRCHNCRGSA